MLRLAQTKAQCRGANDQGGAPTAASDLADAILGILGRLQGEEIGSRAGLYHLAGKGEATGHALASAIFAGWPRRGRRVPKLVAIKSAEYSTAARRPANSRLDCAKIEAEFGIRLPSWGRSLDACLDRLFVQAELQRC